MGGGEGSGVSAWRGVRTAQQPRGWVGFYQTRTSSHGALGQAATLGFSKALLQIAGVHAHPGFCKGWVATEVNLLRHLLLLQALLRRLKTGHASSAFTPALLQLRGGLKARYHNAIFAATKLMLIEKGRRKPVLIVLLVHWLGQCVVRARIKFQRGCGPFWKARPRNTPLIGGLLLLSLASPSLPLLSPSLLSRARLTQYLCKQYVSIPMTVLCTVVGLKQLVELDLYYRHTGSFKFNLNLSLRFPATATTARETLMREEGRASGSGTLAVPVAAAQARLSS